MNQLSDRYSILEQEDDYEDWDDNDNYWLEDEEETTCSDCDRPTALDACEQCGTPLCPMCHECGAGFCSKHPDEDFEDFKPGEEDMHKQWEYLICYSFDLGQDAYSWTFKAGSTPDRYSLEALGRDGWELASSTADGGRYIFKRPRLQMPRHRNEGDF